EGVCGQGSAHLFDHLVGTGEQRRRDRQAERFRSLEIDRELVLGRGLYWQFGWLLAFEDAIDVGRRAPDHIDLVGSVGYQPTSPDGLTELIDGGQAVPGRERYDQIAMVSRESVGQDDEPTQ